MGQGKTQGRKLLELACNLWWGMNGGRWANLWLPWLLGFLNPLPHFVNLGHPAKNRSLAPQPGVVLQAAQVDCVIEKEAEASKDAGRGPQS